MVQSYQKSARIVLAAVMILFSIILFQNCRKKVGLVSVLNDSSTAIDEPMNIKTIDIKIHASSGLNSPEVKGDLDPEETYYLQVRNMSLNGYACIELVDSDGPCLREPGASALIDRKNWRNIGGADAIEQEFVPGSLWFGESVNLYLKESIDDVPSKYTFRVKSPAEIAKPKGVYIWHSLDPEGKNRIRHMSSAGIDGNTKYYSHAINIGAEADKIEICQDIFNPSIIGTSSCVEASGNKMNSGPWYKRPLLKFDDAEGFFQFKVPFSSGDGFRYFNVDSGKDVSTSVTCIKTYLFKDGITYVFPLGFNEGGMASNQSCGGGNVPPVKPPIKAEYIVPKDCRIVPITWPSGYSVVTTPSQQLPQGKMIAFTKKVDGDYLTSSGTAYSSVPIDMSISTNPCDFSESLKLSKCMQGAKGNDPLIWNSTQTNPYSCQLPPVGTAIYYNVKNRPGPAGQDTCPGYGGTTCKFFFYW